MTNMALMPTERMGPPPGALPPMRMTASWSGVKALRNTSVAKAASRQAALAFRSLDPFARSGNLIAGDGTKNGPPAPNKELSANQKHYLTGKAPYKFESLSLHQRVRS